MAKNSADPEVQNAGELNVAEIAAVDKDTITQERATEKILAQAEKTMRQILDEQPKVKMIIPEDPNNPDDVVPVGVNGVIYAIPRGIEVEVPQSIYETWKNSYDQTQKVNKRIRESVTKEVTITG